VVVTSALFDEKEYDREGIGLNKFQRENYLFLKKKDWNKMPFGLVNWKLKMKRVY